MIESIFLILGVISLCFYLERVRAHAQFPTTDEAQHKLTQAYQLRLVSILVGFFTLILFFTELGHFIGVGGLEFLMGQQNLGVMMGVFTPLLSYVSYKFDNKILDNYFNETAEYLAEIESKSMRRARLRRGMERDRRISSRARTEAKDLQDELEKDEIEAQKTEKEKRKVEAERHEVARASTLIKEKKKQSSQDLLISTAKKAHEEAELAHDEQEHAELKRLIKSHNKAIRELKAKQSTIKSEIQDLHHHYNKLKDQSKDSKEKIEASNKKYEELKTQISEMELEISELEKQKIHGEEQSQNLGNKEEETKEIRNRLKKQVSKLDKMLENYRNLLTVVDEAKFEKAGKEAQKKFLTQKAAEEAKASDEELDKSGIYEG